MKIACYKGIPIEQLSREDLIQALEEVATQFKIMQDKYKDILNRVDPDCVLKILVDLAHNTKEQH